MLSAAAFRIPFDDGHTGLILYSPRLGSMLPTSILYVQVVFDPTDSRDVGMQVTLELPTLAGTVEEVTCTQAQTNGVLAVPANGVATLKSVSSKARGYVALSVAPGSG